MKKKYFIIVGVISLVLVLAIVMFLIFKKEDVMQSSPEILQETEELNNNLIVKESIELEINSPIPCLQDFINQDKTGEIKIYLNEKLINNEILDKLGEYSVIITIDNEEYTSKILVKDTIKPELKLKDVTIKLNGKYDINSFIESCTDNSNEECKLEFTKSEMAKYTKTGTYDIEIKATDESNNVTLEQAKLTIKSETKETTTNNINQQSNNASSNNSNQDNVSTSKTLVKTDTETEVTNTTEKYGVKTITTKYITYNYYSDGSKTEVSSYSKDTVDRSGYQATTAELLPEATANASTYASQVNEVLKYVNELRSELGLNPLTLDSTLTQAAMVRSLEMAYPDVVSHTRPDGSSCFTIFNDLSYHAYSMAENIAAGQTTAKAVFESWKNSSGHYKNMTGENFTKIGIGLVKLPGTKYKYYWTQLFAS